MVTNAQIRPPATTAIATNGRIGRNVTRALPAAPWS